MLVLEKTRWRYKAVARLPYVRTASFSNPQTGMRMRQVHQAR